MRVLLDENLDWRLARELPGHDVRSVPLIGWAGTKNGALLRRAASDGFDVLLTMDSGMVHEQNLAELPLAVIALRAFTNRLDDTRPLMPKVLRLRLNVRQGTLNIVS